MDLPLFYFFPSQPIQKVNHKANQARPLYGRPNEVVDGTSSSSLRAKPGKLPQRFVRPDHYEKRTNGKLQKSK